MEPEPSPSALQLENLVEENGFPLMEPPEDAKLVQNMLRSYAADAISISGPLGRLNQQSPQHVGPPHGSSGWFSPVFSGEIDPKMAENAPNLALVGPSLVQEIATVAGNVPALDFHSKVGSSVRSMAAVALFAHGNVGENASNLTEFGQNDHLVAEMQPRSDTNPSNLQLFAMPEPGELIPVPQENTMVHLRQSLGLECRGGDWILKSPVQNVAQMNALFACIMASHTGINSTPQVGSPPPVQVTRGGPGTQTQEPRKGGGAQQIKKTRTGLPKKFLKGNGNKVPRSQS